MKPEDPTQRSLNRPQVKICGLTRVEQAVECVELGADAVGLIFYPKSPRCVSNSQAKTISEAVRGRADVIGVFVDEPCEFVLSTAAHCGLTGVQLHGRESPMMAAELADAGIPVIKALFQTRPPHFDRASMYPARAILLECGDGKLPGGNARRWNWSAARQTDFAQPVLLAGGLNADNVADAIRMGQPDAVDVSSGVEIEPGVKDLQRVGDFISTVYDSRDLYTHRIRRVFNEYH